MRGSALVRKARPTLSSVATRKAPQEPREKDSRMPATTTSSAAPVATTWRVRPSTISWT